MIEAFTKNCGSDKEYIPMTIQILLKGKKPPEFHQGGHQNSCGQPPEII